MTQPTSYSPSTEFQEIIQGIIGPDLDTEFNNLQNTISQILYNLSIIQRDDTLLANGSVHASALGADTILLVAGQTSPTRYVPRGIWVTGTAYHSTDIVQNGSSIYLAVVDHTAAAMFADDLAAVKWILIVTDAGGGAAPSGSIVTLNTVAALRATTQAPDLIQLTGYYAKGDGGGGLLYWDSTSTTADDGGYTFKQTSVTTGRYKRLPTNATIDVRYFGCIEGQTTAVQSAAFSAAVLYFQAQFPHFSTIRAVGALTFDPTLFPYVDEFGYQKIIMAVDIASGVLDRGKIPTLELGGVITFTTPFYHPQFWTVRGIGGQGAAQFQQGAVVEIIGDYVVRSASVRLENLFINGQLFLDGHVTGAGQDSQVYMDNVSATLQGARATAGEAAFRSLNKYWVWGNQCYFTSIGTNVSDPTTSMSIESDFETGLMRFTNSLVAFGAIYINAPGSATNFPFYFQITSESLNRDALFLFNCGGATGIVHLDQCAIADPQVPARLFRLFGGTLRSLKITGCWPTNGYGAELIRFLDTDGMGVFFEYSTVDDDLSTWRQSHRRSSGDFVSSMSSSFGHGCAPGYVKPTCKVLGNTPSGWTTVGGAGFDGISNGYTKAVTVGSQPSIIPLTVQTGVLAVGDVIILGFWAKRLDQANTTPQIQMNLIKTSDGTTNISDTFSGLTTTTGHAALERLAGYGWYYTWAAFKASETGNNYISAYLLGISTATTMTISDVSVLLATGDITYFECYELAMANMRFPSLITAGTPPTNYYSYAPGAYHALRDDVAIGSPVAKVAGTLAGNAWLVGSGATGSRPTGSLPEGSMWFDTTLHKPVFATGAGAWKDAAGSVV